MFINQVSSKYVIRNYSCKHYNVTFKRVPFRFYNLIHFLNPRHFIKNKVKLKIN